MISSSSSKSLLLTLNAESWQIYITLHTLGICGCIVDGVGGLLLQPVSLLGVLPDLPHVPFLGGSTDDALQVHVLHK